MLETDDFAIEEVPSSMLMFRSNCTSLFYSAEDVDSEKLTPVITV